jgi:betaine-aldehyde dehydrogenase
VRVLTNFINGERVAAADGQTTDLINPTTGQVFGSAPLSGDEDVNRAYAAAEAAFVEWGDTTPSERQKALLTIADALEAHGDELVALESENTGKAIAVTTSEELPPMIDHIRFFAGAARVLEGRSAGEYAKGFTSIIRREPIGVVGQVTPWNYPMMMAVWKYAPAIAAGNTVVLKPSDTTPVSTVRMAELITDAGILPPGVLNVITGDRDTGRALVSHPTPQMVAITGSVRAGMEVAGEAARDVKRVHLELGGKAPIVIFDDADVEAAAEWLAVAGYFNAGQDCTAATRMIVAPGIYDDFVSALGQQAAATATTFEEGPGGEALVPPVNNVNQLERVLGFIERAPSHARVVAGGKRQGDRGFYIEPTVIADLRQDDEMIQNEMFGPVITVQKFSDEAQALAWAEGEAVGVGGGEVEASVGVAESE